MKSCLASLAVVAALCVQAQTPGQVESQSVDSHNGRDQMTAQFKFISPRGPFGTERPQRPASQESVEGQLRARGMYWIQTDGAPGPGDYVLDTLTHRLNQPAGRGDIGKVVSMLRTEDGQPAAQVDFGADYSVGIVLSELARVRILDRMDACPPVVVRTVPEAGSERVPPGMAEIRATFSREMSDGSWGWCDVWEHSMPEMMSDPRYLADHKTVVLKVRLEPGKTYGFWINSTANHGFQDTQQQPAVPYLLTFKTDPAGLPPRMNDMAAPVPPPPPTADQIADLKARLAATANMTSFGERDEALASIAARAAAMGSMEITRTAVTRMTSFTSRDEAICTCARKLVAVGKRPDALELARLITSFSTRDSLIKELAR
jgi:hypothetical protein